MPNDAIPLSNGKLFRELHETNKRKIRAASIASSAPVLEKRRAERRVSQAYIDDLENKRDAYADRKLDDSGTPVRDYVKVDTAAPDGGAEERKARNRAACAKSYASQSDEKRFKTLQRNWAAKQRKKGWSEQQIDLGLEKRQANFDQSGSTKRITGYARDPKFGQF